MRSIPVVLLLAATTSLAAQSDRGARFMENCRNNRNDDERFCETRNVTLAATRALTVDGRSNGGVSIHGWDRNEIQVLAMIQANAESVDEAQAIARQVQVLTNGGEIRSDGPRTDRRESWSVSFEVWAPRGTDLSLLANNGGISIESMAAKIEAETQNGGISLKDVQGDVRGRTVNGGITAELTGDRWIGAGLDLRTSNGGVHLVIPERYSANLETGTVNGRVNVDFPITFQGRLDPRQISTALGAGGAPVRVSTTNGGVTVRHR